LLKRVYTIDKKFSLKVRGDITNQGSNFGYCVTFTKKYYILYVCINY